MKVIEMMVRGRMFELQSDEGTVGYKPASREARLTGRADPRE